MNNNKTNKLIQTGRNNVVFYRKDIMNNNEKNKLEANMTNKLDKIINSTNKIDFSAEEINKLIFELSGFRNQIEICTMNFGENAPVVNKLVAIVDRAIKKLNQHSALTYI